MARTDWLILIGGALLILLLALPVHAQVMQRDTLVCDLVVNDLPISWPPKSLGKDECLSMRQELKARDETKARIVCECTVGDRA